MKLRYSDPVVVAMGPDSRTAGWGRYQFPEIYKLDDGALVYTFSDNVDSETAYGSEPGCRVSYDGGKTWNVARTKDFAGKLGLKLPNGEVLQADTWTSIPLEGLKLPKPIGRTTWLGHTIYAADEIDFCDRSWKFIRYSKEHPEGVHELSTVNQPYFMMRSCHGVFVPPSPRGSMLLAPDGTLWLPHYYLAGTNPKNGGYIPYLCNYLFQSKDNGHTWDLVNWLPYIPDTDENPDAFAYEGFGENYMTFAPDGSMVRLIRTDGCYPRQGPSYITRSTDGGHTWTKPEKFDDCGVKPQLLTLKCGVTLASYGRPGLRVRATDDPKCITWDDPVELIHATGKDESMLDCGTCAYTSMIALDDHTAALVYSDFRVTDGEGIPHKTMMFRTITVED